MQAKDKRFLLETLEQSSHDNFFFVQIGSNDGVTRDPIYPFVLSRGWQGIAVEPVRYLFTRLQRNYRDLPVDCVNAAIGSEEGEATIHRLSARIVEDHPDVPLHWEQIASFSKAHLEKHRDSIPYAKEYVVEEKVPVLTFERLAEGVEGIDLLHIDTEGHDFEIIKTIDFSRLKPRMILYEHKHLSPEDLERCHSLLEGEGYAIFRVSEEDDFAVLDQ